MTSDVSAADNLTNDNVVLSLSNLDAFEASLQSFNGAQSVQSIARGGELFKAVAEFVTAAVAENTRRAYRQDLEDFQRWGGVVPCSPEILAAYIADRAATLSPHTITRRVVGLCRAHVSQGLPDPAKNDLVRTVLRGVRRKLGAPQRQVAPLLKQDLLAILPHMQGSVPEPLAGELALRSYLTLLCAGRGSEFSIHKQSPA